MSDDILASMARQLHPADATREVLLRAMAAGDGEAPPPESEPADAPSPRRRRVWFAAAAAAALVVGLAFVPSMLGGRAGPAAPTGAGGGQAGAAGPGDYADLYTAVSEAMARSANGAFTEGGMAEGAAPGSVQDNATAAGSYETNTQVAGIDEGDVVKSDGRTVFVADGSDVVLVSAAGRETRQVARIDTGAGEAGPDRTKDSSVVQGPVQELILNGSTLVALVTEYKPALGQITFGSPTTYVPYNAVQTKALLYDVSDPANPRYLSSLGQSGAYATSRLVDDILYLVTTHVVIDGDLDPDDPATFVPSVTEDRQAMPLGPADCDIMPVPSGPTYTVVSSLDLAARSRIDTESVLAGSHTVYLNTDNLFLAASDWETPMTEDDLPAAGFDEPVRDVTGTNLIRIAISDGELSVGAKGTVPGQLINQFALDEYEGHLRAAVTVNGSSAKDEWISQPALYVLDADLTIVGSLPQLAKDESIQSVRFDGPVGYVVSFEQVDPLFALDLSQPDKPAVMSALKVPGFSTYLHPWSDGRLLGLGMNGDETGEVQGMKLSMFDTSDPYDVKELVTQKVPFDDSEALYNHKAVLIDADAGLIGFPAQTWKEEKVNQRYLVHRYVDGAFESVAELQPRMPDGALGVRGLTIEGALYVVSTAGVAVYDLEGFAELASVQLA